ncbi:MAG TPA: DUF397 domain-containing protein [Streptomyces sp.]
MSADKHALYALDLTGVEWLAVPGSDPANRVEIAHLPEGAVAMRHSAGDGRVLRFDAAEWAAFKLGALDGEFDV